MVRMHADTWDRNRRIGNPRVAEAERQRRSQPQGGAPAANEG